MKHQDYIYGTSAVSVDAPHLRLIQGGKRNTLTLLDVTKPTFQTITVQGSFSKQVRLTPLFMTFSLVFMILVGSLLISDIQKTHRTSELYSRISPITYQVISGDTLWELAAAEASDPSQISDLVQWMVDTNNLSTKDLQVGQRLLVPHIS